MRILPRLAPAALVAWLVVACAQPPVGLSISLAPSAVEVVRGGDGEVIVTVGGAGTGDVVLAIDGLPEHVTGTFAPPTLVGGATSSTLTLTSSAASPSHTTSSSTTTVSTPSSTCSRA